MANLEITGDKNPAFEAIAQEREAFAAKMAAVGLLLGDPAITDAEREDLEATRMRLFLDSQDPLEAGIATVLRAAFPRSNE